MTVAEFRGHLELNALPRLRDEMRLREADRHNARIIRLRPRCTSGDPVGDGLVFDGVHLKALITLVWHRFNRLEQKQTARRIFECQPATIRAAGDGDPVALVIKTTQGKPKTTLPCGSTVTRTHGATIAREDWLDGVAKRGGVGGWQSRAKGQNTGNKAGQGAFHEDLVSTHQLRFSKWTILPFFEPIPPHGSSSFGEIM